MKERFMKAAALWSSKKRLWVYLAVCVVAWLGNIALVKLPAQLEEAGWEPPIMQCALAGLALLFVARWVSSWILQAQKAPYLARFLRVCSVAMVLIVACLWVLGKMPTFLAFLGAGSPIALGALWMFAACLVYLLLPYVELVGFFGWQKKVERMTVCSVCSKIMWVCLMAVLSVVIWTAIGMAAAPEIMASEAGLVEQDVLALQAVSFIVLFFLVPLQLIVAAWIRPTWKASVLVLVADIVLAVVWSHWPTMYYGVPMAVYAAILIGCLLPAPRCCRCKAVAVVPPKPVAVVTEHPVVALAPAPVARRGRPAKGAQSVTAQKAKTVKGKRGRPAKKKTAVKKPAKKAAKKAKKA
ncbi:MAG: hypothetical protein ILP11_00505 [Alphaproteobacteria bacterium]|nr:hypothetical protein [Alphaproteobacteria bacterium]